MTISNASEIQFWPIDDDTFNNQVKAYTDEDVQYNQRFLSSSKRRIQGIDDDGIAHDYVLRGYDADGLQILEAPFTSYQEYPGNPADIFENIPFSGWDNEDVSGSNPWTLSSTPNAETGISATYTDKLISTIAVRKQTLTIFVNTLVELAAGKLKIEFFKEGVSVGSGESLPTAVGAIFQDIEVSVTLTDDADQVKLQWARTGVGNSKAYVSSATCAVEAQDGTVVVYNVEFTPDDESITDECVSFKILKGPNESDEYEEEYHSDLVEFVSSWETSPRSGRIQIQYRSSKNFAGIVYEYDETTTYFNIELEGKFLKERNQTTTKSIELTEKIINTAVSIKTQRRMIIDYMPDYMHKKVQLILAHAGSGEVLIDGKSWTLEETYEQGEVPESFPLSPATLYLTEKNSYEQNVI